MPKVVIVDGVRYRESDIERLGIKGKNKKTRTTTAAGDLQRVAVAQVGTAAATVTGNPATVTETPAAGSEQTLVNTGTASNQGAPGNDAATGGDAAATNAGAAAGSGDGTAATAKRTRAAAGSDKS